MTPRPRTRPSPQTLLVVGVALLAQVFSPRGAAALPIGRDWNEIASGRTAWIVVGAAALTAASLAAEDPNAEERALGGGLIDGPADVGNLYGSGVTLAGAAAGLAGAALLAPGHEWSRAGSEMARSLVYTGVVVTGLKVAIRRTRPNGGAYSFPSGHTAAAFAVAPVIARRFGWAVGLSAYALAAGTAAGRMEDRKHFLSDVVFGAGIGSAIGIAVASAGGRNPSEEDVDSDRAATEPRDARLKPALGIEPAPSGVALTLKF